MSRSCRNAAAAFVLLSVVVIGAGVDRPAGAYNPCPSPATQQDCQGNPGGSDSNGGRGGGSAGGGSPGSGSSPGGAGGNTSPGGGGNTSAGGGQGGAGNSGTAGANSTPTPIPTSPPPGQDSIGSSGSASTGGTSASKGTSSAAAAAAAAAANADPRLVAWAKRFKTSPEEVMSWFGTYTSEDSIGGEAPVVAVHGNDLVTISDHEVARAPGDSTSSLLDPAKRDNGVATADGQRVDIVMHSDAIVLGSATSDPSGRFSATVSVPASLQAGRHFIVALAPKPNGGRAAFVFPVTIADHTAAAPVTVNQPRAAKQFPWLLFEAVLGTVLVVALFVVRVNTTVR